MRIGIAALVLGLLLAQPVVAPADADGGHRHRESGVSLTADTREAVLGAVVTFTGRVWPAPSSGRVVLQERPAGAADWTKVASVPVSARGRYQTHLTFSRLGATAYRVTTSPRRQGSARTSPETTLTGYRWQPLTSLTPIQLGYMRIGTATLGGVEYPSSLIADPPTSRTISNATYDFGGACLEARTTAGTIATSAGSISSAIFDVSTSRGAHPLGSFGAGQSGHVTASLRGSGPTTFLITAQSGVGAYGLPEVLCSF